MSLTNDEIKDLKESIKGSRYSIARGIVAALIERMEEAEKERDRLKTELEKYKNLSVEMHHEAERAHRLCDDLESQICFAREALEKIREKGTQEKPKWQSWPALTASEALQKLDETAVESKNK